MEIENLYRRVRILATFFIVALILSGLTAIPLKWEVGLLSRLMTGPVSPLALRWPELVDWIEHINIGLQDTYGQYPFIAYGTDWLAFGHIVIAIAFLGLLKDPVKNIWVIEFGMIACVLVVPMALIFGPIRGIPLFWRLIDCSFGVFGMIPLWAIRKAILRLSELERKAA